MSSLLASRRFAFAGCLSRIRNRGVIVLAFGCRLELLPIIDGDAAFSFELGLAGNERRLCHLLP
jgi:hypothetical protein